MQVSRARGCSQSSGVVLTVKIICSAASACYRDPHCRENADGRQLEPSSESGYLKMSFIIIAAVLQSLAAPLV